MKLGKYNPQSAVSRVKSDCIVYWFKLSDFQNYCAACGGMRINMDERKKCGCGSKDDSIRENDKIHNIPGNCNKGVNCDVKNCYYHDGSCLCTAEQINVGPHSADTSADTLCATFKHKAD